MKIIHLNFIRTAIGAVAVLCFLSACSGSPPPQLGLENGSLRPCPDSPNCVNSYAGLHSKNYVSPLRWDRNEHPGQSLRTTIESTGGSVKKVEGNYIWATYTSFLFRFVDDVEFLWIPTEKQIHIRSASRLGYSDLGVNKKRAKDIQQQWQEKFQRNE